MSNFAEEFREKYPHEIFTNVDLSTVFYAQSRVAIHSGISRSLRAKDFIKLKRGVYIFGHRLQRGKVSKFKIANRLYSPSYVSFESALSHHGWIPEAVYTLSSATMRRAAWHYPTPLGHFSYEYIPKNVFFLGVVPEGGILLAHPLKALFDYVYQKRKTYSLPAQIESDLRIELSTVSEAVEQVGLSSLQELAEGYRKKTTLKLFQTLKAIVK